MSYGAIGETQRISHKYVLDKYGRCIKEIDNLGSETEYEYDDAGNLIEATTGYGGRIKKTYNRYDGYNRFGFCGEYFDEETGLIYLRNRYYNPNTGRFITEDPVKDGLNWYIYCENNPVMFVDPLGLYQLEYGDSGKVYAIIEKGDTLSELAQAEVGDASAYSKMKYTEDPNIIEIGQKIDITGIYNDSYPQPFIVEKTKNSDIPPASSGYRPPKKGHKWNREKGGWEDIDGNVWVPDKSGHGEGKHWDVLYPNGGYDNVYEDGHVRAGKGKRGKFSPVTKTVVENTTSNSKESETQFWQKVTTGVITVVGAAAGVYYFIYTGDSSMIFKYAY